MIARDVREQGRIAAASSRAMHAPGLVGSDDGAFTGWLARFYPDSFDARSRLSPVVFEP